MWGHRRSTSITNVAYTAGGGGAAAPLSRRSSERELSDTPKKRATSAGGLDRNDGNFFTTFFSFYFVPNDIFVGDGVELFFFFTFVVNPKLVVYFSC